MPSFISNSKFRFIASTLGFFIAMLIAYEYIISIYHLRSSPEDEFHTNVILAQEYIYQGMNKPIVIVGSSFALRLRNFMEDRWALLALSGGTALTGLEIIERNRYLPEVVLVEVSYVLTRPADEDLISSLFVPMLWQIKGHLPSLQEKNRPISVVVNYIEEAMRKAIHRPSIEDDKNSRQGVDPVAFDILFREQIKSTSTVPDARTLDDNIAKMSLLIAKLKGKGVHVIFFETPMHPDLSESVLMRFIRDKLTSIFPPKDYLWMRRSDNLSYQTIDGCHLTAEGAAEFYKELQHNINILIDQKHIVLIKPAS